MPVATGPSEEQLPVVVRNLGTQHPYTGMQASSGVGYPQVQHY